MSEFINELTKKILSSNILAITVTIFVSCMVLPGNCFVYFFNKELYLQLDIFKLLLVSITPTLLLFSIIAVTVFAFSVASSDKEDNYFYYIVTYSSIMSAIFCLTLCYLKYFASITFAEATNYVILLLTCCLSVFGVCYLIDKKIKPWRLKKKK